MCQKKKQTRSFQGDRIIGNPKEEMGKMKMKYVVLIDIDIDNEPKKIQMQL